MAQPLAAGTTYTLNMSLSTATVNATPFSATNTSSATLKGGEGNDFLQGTLGNDIINGGNGNDTASFATAFSNTDDRRHGRPEPARRGPEYGRGGQRHAERHRESGRFAV